MKSFANHIYHKRIIDRCTFERNTELICNRVAREVFSSLPAEPALVRIFDRIDVIVVEMIRGKDNHHDQVCIARDSNSMR